MVKICYLNTAFLNDDSVYNEYYGKISEFRKRKIDRFVFRKDKNLCLGAGISLDKMLERYNLSECSVKYIIGENGKPILAEYPHIHFNISHSGQYVMCAFSDEEIGCDIEKIQVMNMDVAKRFFAADEYEYICNLVSDEERKNAFFRLWTMKESVMKITGLGMKLSPDKFCISFEDKIRVNGESIREDFSFYEYLGIKEYASAICMKREEIPDIEFLDL